MMSDVAATTATSREEFGAMWRRQQPYWHAVFAIVWTAAVVVTLVDDPGLLGRGPSLVLLGVIAAAYAVLGTRAMTHRDLRWAVAYQVVAWSALLGIQWVDPSTQAWLLYFTLFPQLWAMVPTRWAVIGTVLVVTAFSLVRWAQLRLLRRQPHRDPHLRHHLDGPVPLARALHQPDRRSRPRAAPRRSTSSAPPRPGSLPRSATAGCTRSASASRARSTTPSRRGSPRWSPSPARRRPRWPAVTPPAARERLALIEHTASDNLDEARLIVAELTPGHLQSRTLGEALERLGAAVTSETGMRADVRVAGNPVPLGGSAEVVILRTAQEALSNVRRHASAARVDLTLAYDDPDEVVLTVRDDGLGFDLDGARSGFGLDGVQARAAEVGGAVEVLSEPGTGTTLRLVVPR